MKLYFVSYLTVEKGEIEAFLSKAKAQKRWNEIKRETADHERRCVFGDEKDCHHTEDVEMLYELREAEFPISAEGIRQAFEAGAWSVSK